MYTYLIIFYLKSVSQNVLSVNIPQIIVPDVEYPQLDLRILAVAVNKAFMSPVLKTKFPLILMIVFSVHLNAANVVMEILVWNA